MLNSSSSSSLSTRCLWAAIACQLTAMLLGKASSQQMPSQMHALTCQRVRPPATARAASEVALHCRAPHAPLGALWCRQA